MKLLTKSSDFCDALAIVSSGNEVLAIVSIAAIADSDFSSTKHTSTCKFCCNCFFTIGTIYTLRLKQTTVKTTVVNNAVALMIVIVLILGPPICQNSPEGAHYPDGSRYPPTVICVVLELIQRRCRRWLGFISRMSVRSSVLT